MKEYVESISEEIYGKDPAGMPGMIQGGITGRIV